MTWLIGFLMANMMQIAAVGGVFAAGTQVVNFVTATHQMVDVLEEPKPEEKK